MSIVKRWIAIARPHLKHYAKSCELIYSNQALYLDFWFAHVNNEGRGFGNLHRCIHNRPKTFSWNAIYFLTISNINQDRTFRKEKSMIRAHKFSLSPYCAWFSFWLPNFYSITTGLWKFSLICISTSPYNYEIVITISLCNINLNTGGWNEAERMILKWSACSHAVHLERMERRSTLRKFNKLS